MKAAIIILVIASTILLAGCGKQGPSTGRMDSPTPPPVNSGPANPLPPTKTTVLPTTTTAAAVPVMQPIIAAWQEGDKKAAITRFQEADWNSRPVFAAGMVVGFSEAQFKALSADDREWRSRELTVQLDLLKQLIEMVAQTARDAAAKGEFAQARKSFTSLQNFGLTLDRPDRLQFVQHLGKVSKNMANNELAKLPQ